MLPPQQRKLSIETLETRDVLDIGVGVTPFPAPGSTIHSLYPEETLGVLYGYGQAPDGSPYRTSAPEFSDGSPGQPVEEETLATLEGFSTGRVLKGRGSAMAGSLVNDVTLTRVAAFWTSPTEVSTPFGLSSESEFLDFVEFPRRIALARVDQSSQLLVEGAVRALPAGFEANALLEPAPGETHLLISGSLNGRAAVTRYDLNSGELTSQVPAQAAGENLSSALEISRVADGSNQPSTLLQRQFVDGSVSLATWNLESGIITEIADADPGSVQSSYGVTIFSQEGAFKLHVSGLHEAKLLGVEAGTVVSVEERLAELGFNLSLFDASIQSVSEIDASREFRVTVVLDLLVNGVAVPVELHAGDPTPFQNPDSRVYGKLDVNGDSRITAFDALNVINYLNINGAGPLGRFSEVPGLRINSETGQISFNSYLDVTGDSLVTAFDALLIINHLNTLGTSELQVNPVEPSAPEFSGGEMDTESRRERDEALTLYFQDEASRRRR